MNKTILDHIYLSEKKKKKKEEEEYIPILFFNDFKPSLIKIFRFIGVGDFCSSH